MTESSETETFSVMEAYPQHLLEIGKMNVEVSRLELTLGLLLAALAGTSGRIGQTIYLTPHAQIARLSMIRNIIPYALNKDDKELRSEIDKIIVRAEKLIGQRHGYIHYAYGAVNNTVLRTPLPMLDGKFSEIVELDELKRLNSAIRKLISVVGKTTERLNASRSNH